MTEADEVSTKVDVLPKAPTGIAGLDEITRGGLPRGRSTLVCGGPGCGKTLLGIEFLARGAAEFNEPGVMMSFEETTEEIIQNASSLGLDVGALIEAGKLAFDHVEMSHSEIQEAGEYNLDGLFLRLDDAVRTTGARRVVLDTLEVLFSGFTDTVELRSEIRRLFRWLKDRGLTTVITAERGEGALTRNGLEEYVSDCVIFLDHEVRHELSTRRLRIVKYRGSAHGTNAYPFLIDETGIAVLPITSVGLNHTVSTERVSTGIERLDAMLDGCGLYRGSSVLISGTAGTGKSSIAATAANASCLRGEKCLYFAFEESPAQIIRNMGSIGLDLAPWVEKGLLRFSAVRPTLSGLELHLVSMFKAIRQFRPRLVIVDPITNFTASGNSDEVKAMMMRLIDYLKTDHVTGIFTSLTEGGGPVEQSEIGVSSLIDTWLLVRGIEGNGERNRVLYILKSRGMPHSNQMREYVLTHRGVELLDVYLGPEGVLTGSARQAQAAREEAEALAARQSAERKRRELERRRQLMETRIKAMRADFDAEEEEFHASLQDNEQQAEKINADRTTMAELRRADAITANSGAAANS